MLIQVVSMKSLIKNIKNTINKSKHRKYFKQLNPQLKEALKQIQRTHFVNEKFAEEALQDQVISLGYGQVTSQPFVITFMLQVLDIAPSHKVLEVGTGSGYQTALLSQMAYSVVSLEIIPELCAVAQKRITALNLDNVEIINKNGCLGERSMAPYDRIIISAATPQVPEALLTQLKIGGKMILPLGEPIFPQKLMVIEKISNMEAKAKELIRVKFVPMIEINKVYN